MPFTGELNGNIVWPDDVDKGDVVSCPECGDRMHVRSGHTTKDGVLKPRCFAHNPEANVGGMCSGGESDIHKMMKYVVSRRFRRMFDHGEVQREKSIPETDRIADVAISFESPIGNFGNGVIGEVQYRNEDKDIQAVTTDYLNAGYSVYWFNQSHFGEGHETVDFPNIISVWPNAVPNVVEWSGVDDYLSELSTGASAKIDVKIPPDWFRENKHILKQHWEIGSSLYDVDIVRSLGDNSADRKCSECSEPASYYLFQDGIISTFRCDTHLTEDLPQSKEVVE